MARAAVGSGIGTIAATPHLHPSFPGVHVDELADRCRAVREALFKQQIPLELVSGAEVSVTWALDATDQQLQLASYAQRGTDLLVETPFTQVPGFDRFLHTLRARGFRVTLGHPERNGYFQRDDSQLRALVEQGILLQVNADSLLGTGGSRGPKRLARTLLTDGIAHVLASDGHRGSSWRPVTRLAEGVEAAAQLMGEERARWMVAAVPAAIIAGADLPAPPPIDRQRPRRRLFGRR